MNRYRVTWNNEYLFHCSGENETDALEEARKIAGYAMRSEVVNNLVVSMDS